jgi:hypothetical protein
MGSDSQVTEQCLKFEIGLEASHGNFMLEAMNVGMQKLEP